MVKENEHNKQRNNKNSNIMLGAYIFFIVLEPSHAEVAWFIPNYVLDIYQHQRRNDSTCRIF